MEARPTTNMKKGWLCRNFCDEKNQEIAPFWDSIDDDDPDQAMIQTWWWSWSSDDPDLMMIQWWWSSNDDPDPVMKKTWRRRRWLRRRLEDEGDLKMKNTWRQRRFEEEEDLKMKKTWRWRELEDEDDKMIQSIQRRRRVLKIVSNIRGNFNSKWAF